MDHILFMAKTVEVTVPKSKWRVSISKVMELFRQMDSCRKFHRLILENKILIFSV